MLLGVYWYFGFPTGLYQFDYFAFQKGFGGHADGPAELTATVQVPDQAALLNQLRALSVAYPETLLLVERTPETLRLILGDYQLPDYAFFVAQEVEKLLRAATAVPAAPASLPSSERLRLGQMPSDNRQAFRYRLLQMVGSEQRKHHAENLSLRLDCHLPTAQKDALLAGLNRLCDQADLDVLYYFDAEIKDQTNLMLFLTNGRQGMAGRPLRYTDGQFVENAVQELLAAHGGQPNHLGHSDQYYPARGPHIVRMVDADFIL